MEKNNLSFDRKQLMQLFGKKSDFKGFKAIILNWTAFATCFYFCGYAITNLTVPWILVCYIPLSFMSACTLRGFDNLTHEGSHKNIFDTPWMNDFFQFLFAFPVCKTLEDYWFYHKPHHQNYVKNKAQDPDTEQNIRWGIEHLASSKTLKQILWFYVIRFLCFYYTLDNIRYSFFPHLKSKNALVQRVIFWVCVLSLVYLTSGWVYFLAGYCIPYFIWLPFIRFVTESSKHTNVNLEDDFANSRNNIGLFHQWFLHPHNDGFHQMHHYMASIPFYNLKKAYKFIKKDEQIKAKLIESHNPFQTIKQTLKRI